MVTLVSVIINEVRGKDCLS